MQQQGEAVYLSVSDVASLLGGVEKGWTYLRTWRWLKKAHALTWRGGRLVTTPELLVDAFPEVYDRVG